MAGASHRAPAPGHRGRRLWNRWTFPVLTVALNAIVAGVATGGGHLYQAITASGVAGALAIHIIRSQASEARDWAEITALRQRADTALSQKRLWGVN